MTRTARSSKRSGSVSVYLSDELDLVRLFGSYDQHLKVLERMLGLSIRARGHELQIKGAPAAVAAAQAVIGTMSRRLRQSGELSLKDVVLAAQKRGADAGREPADGALRAPTSVPGGNGPAIHTEKMALTPKTPTQRRYIEALKTHDIVIGIGPAGTGKTYLAMGMAVEALLNQEVKRIVLTRPVVEAGERLGFLPGDLYAKVNPFVRPLYDALYDMMDVEQVNRLIERGEIEIAPLAYMRGRTLNDAFIILDEAQNTTAEQMKMFLTRMGFRSKVVVTGDVTQVDLPTERGSGLVEAQKILGRVSGIAFVNFSQRDVVRHPLLQEIIRAYERHEARQRKSPRRLRG